MDTNSIILHHHFPNEDQIKKTEFMGLTEFNTLSETAIEIKDLATIADQYRLKKIRIWAGEDEKGYKFINGIQTEYIDVITNKNITNNKYHVGTYRIIEVKEFELGDTELITKIEYYSENLDNRATVYYLCLSTNQGRAFFAGSQHGIKFIRDFEEDLGFLVGFAGGYGGMLHFLECLVYSTSVSITYHQNYVELRKNVLFNQAFGKSNPGSKKYDDMNEFSILHKDPSCYKIKEIEFYEGSTFSKSSLYYKGHVNGLKITYINLIDRTTKFSLLKKLGSNKNAKPTNPKKVKFEEEEEIINVVIYSEGDIISTIAFETSLNNKYTIGNTGKSGILENFEIPKNSIIIGTHGTYSSTLNSIGFYTM